MTGRVNEELEAIAEITVRLGGIEARLPAVVDTGFSEFLVLPSELLAASAAVVERREQLTLGDGTVVSMDTYVVEVEWSGEWGSVKAYASEGETLVGMRLLAGHDLSIRVVRDGVVRIERA